MRNSKLLTKLLATIYPRYSSEVYITFLRKKGVKIGKNCIFASPKSINIDITRPSLVSFGDNVKMGKGTIILSHGYDFCIFVHKYGDVMPSSGKVTVGNNVFIGIKTTILKGVCIGDDVIIGANSLVNKDIPSNVVVAGNPARVIMTLDEYHEKRKKLYIEEAKEYAISIKERFGRLPREDDFREFFPIFIKRDKDVLSESNIDILTDHTHSKDLIDKFLKTEPPFQSFDDFLEFCGLK